MITDSSHLDDLTKGFLAESREMLDEVEPYLIELGQRSAELGEVDEETVNLVFRLFHSLKGSAGFFQFGSIVGLTHIAETLLDLFRSGQCKMAQQHTDVLCRACDVVGMLLDQVEATGSDTGYENEVEQISKELMALIEGQGARPDSAPRCSAPDLRTPLAEQGPQETEASLEDEIAEEIESDNFQVIIPVSDFLEKFVQEADEQLDLVENVLLEWPKNPGNWEDLNAAFRAMHSFKGNCGICGFSELEGLSHRAETVMEAIKDGELKMETASASLLHIVDVLRNAVADVSRGGQGEINNLSVLMDMLTEMAPLAEDENIALRADIIQAEALTLLRENAPAPTEATDAAGLETSKAGNLPAFKARSVVRHDIRVDLRKLDQLINLVGEMVIAESMVTRNPDLEGYEFENFEKAASHLNKIVRDLQDVALSVRMIPIAGIFRKMIRLVHDLSARADKKIDLKLLGEETEIDKTVAEQLADPLVHLVRNAIDHGIEPPAQRLAAGKPETGEIVIEAKHEGGEVWILITDDGKGLNRDKILTKGIERGLVKGDGSELTDNEIYNLIFEPGFSTADKVTDISGRGVGMDVVKKNIEKIKGRADVFSQQGKGARFILRIPLTLAIMEGMLVRVGQARYTIPILSIRESMQITNDRVTTTMDGQEVVKVRNELLPVLRLHELHKIEPDHTELSEGLLVILEGHGEAFCLFVDEILGEEQTVIKGLSKFMGDVRGVSGCTILGDGEISMILDVGGLVALALGKSKDSY